eukprot:augustus_masked-scaffold_2-processed-gene-22.44-mRNA-1 protein AED:1.00 eAED:1.00 QI:0/-1/0/0/-1/1/1/0/423
MHPPARRSYEELTSDYTFHFNNTRLMEIMKRLSVVRMHCKKGSKLVRRPRDITVLGSRPREILLMDFLYIDESGYILVLVDSMSRKVQLSYEKRATALAAARELCWLRSRYGFLQNFVLFNDRGSHFCNKLLDLMQRLFRFSQQWAISYSPFTDGGIETTNGPILRILRTILSEYRMGDKEWPDLLPHIEYQLNHSASKINQGLTPNEVFVYFKDEGSLWGKHTYTVLYIKGKGTQVMWKPKSVTKIRKEVRKLAKELKKIGEQTNSHTELLRDKENARYNEKNRVKVAQFIPRDWVLLSRAGTSSERYKKLKKWTGPYMVTNTYSSNAYEVESLFGTKQKAHATRLMLYEPTGWMPAKEIGDQYSSDLGFLEVECIRGLRLRDSIYELKIRWKGFLYEDETWEPMLVIEEDLPDVVHEYLND